MECKLRFCVRILVFQIIFVLFVFTSDASGVRRFRRPGPPMVKVGKEVITLNLKPSARRSGPGAAQTVDIAPLLGVEGRERQKNVASSKNFNSRNLLSPKLATSPAGTSPGVLILRRKSPKPRSMNVFRRPLSQNERLHYSNYLNKHAGLNGIRSVQLQQNRRSFDTHVQPPILNSNKAKLAWIALLQSQQRQRAIDKLQQQQQFNYGLEAGKSQYYKSIIPLLYHYKMQKQAAQQYHAKYLKTLQLLALATSQSPAYSSTPELDLFTRSFKNSPYGSLLKNSSFIPTNSVEPDNTIKIDLNDLTNSTNNDMEDQIAEASERHDTVHEEYTSHHRELEKQKRKLLEVFPPPHSEIPFGERTILMVRFPPVPEPEHHKNKVIHLSKAYDIDGGITFGGPRWLSFGAPFDPFDHPWYHTPPPPPKEPSKLVLTEADKPSGYGVIISQTFIHNPSIRFTNSDPKSLAKHKGDLLNGGPSIVTQLAKTLAEGNRISNSYFLSKNVHKGKTWANPETKPPFVIVHLDTYTKKSNESSRLGLDEDVEANYANGTIIYPTKNDPNILASTKFEFHNAKEIDHIFDKPLAILGHGYGWGEVPVYPKGINEIRNFLRLMYKVHQEAHDGARWKSEELKKHGDKLERPAFRDSKPLLRDQIADRSVNWLHTSSVGIRSLSEDDDHFPYSKHPVVDVSKDYDHFL